MRDCINNIICRFTGGLAALLVLWSVVFMQAPVNAAEVEAVRLWQAPDHTRLVFDLSGGISYNIFNLDNPDRVVIDIANSTMRTDFSGLDYSDSPIRSIRSSIRDGNDLRVVLDLKSRVDHSNFTLGANGEFRDRLVMDLYDPQGTDVTTTRTVPTARQSDKRDLLVAVVAGHGGEDPGAPSFNRQFWEKDVTLSISRAIEDRLRLTPGYTPVMIRKGDYSLDLKSRPIIARDKRVDIYISIHADSYRGSSVQGVTIYALSGETADRENIRRIEQKENRADLLGGIAGDTRISDVDDDLAFTLLDLSMAWSMEQSVELGTQVLASLDGVARLRKSKVQGGNLWELRSPDIPSILIETGYLSNPSEARKLASTGYQNKLADAIVQGVKNYFYENPPDGTLVAWQKENGIVPESYVVKRGDSLSRIAQRFRVSLNQLKLANSLRGNVIQIGQTLTIPGEAGMSRSSEHRITRGETLSGIAQRYRVSLASLRRVNNINGDKIMVGQVLKIPAS
ncbi:MAG: N-acetylmuramoyl-L-alanine amidase [Gammaproteobacteria bacterium]|nr:N-acetylmuramoyl-L-alanine amidase [Gammaproteobacteria bacterium]